MVVESIHGPLEVAVPYDNAHIVAGRREDVGVERRKFDLLDSELVAC